MRRIGQVEAKSNGIFIESFENSEDFREKESSLDTFAKQNGRECAYIVIPFDFGNMVMIHVYLMPKDYKFIG